MAIEPTKQPSINLLNLEEYERIKSVYVNIFDAITSSFVLEGDVEELSKYIGDFYTSFRLYQISLPQSVERNNQVIFSNAFIRDFHLELLERVVLEITPIGEDVFIRLINTLAKSSFTSKAEPSKNRQDTGIEAVLTSIAQSFEDVRSVYLQNPWLVSLSMLNMVFRATVLGQKPLTDLR